ncbi:hypothetical protein WJX72_004889 [[Myrmecia] bisecta]|uniref:Glycosyltransferase 61 catalytic domain-containing protein n=1 Tax=[Myrmecia] bisecta TaxID=41462 RepID=A0AAW1Q1E5_9CHLO
MDSLMRSKSNASTYGATQSRSPKLAPIKTREQAREGFRTARQQAVRRMMAVLMGFFVALACFLAASVLIKTGAQPDVVRGWPVSDSNATAAEAPAAAAADEHDPALIPGKGFQIPYSGLDCRVSVLEISHLVCLYTNVFIWKEEIYYITDDLNAPLPGFHITWVEMDDRIRWMRVIKVRPNELPFVLEDHQIEPVEQAAFWYFGQADNYGHGMGEHLPTLHNLLCKYLNRCDYEADSDLRIFRLNQDKSAADTEALRFPGAVEEALKCFTPKPVLPLGHSSQERKVIWVKNGIAGIGPECRAFHWCQPAYKRLPVRHDIMASFRHRIGACTGWDDSVKSARDPLHIVIADRQAEQHRAILNIAAVKRHMEESYEGAKVDVVYLDGRPLLEQINAVKDASIFILMHGSGIANFWFLPKGSVAVHVAAWSGYPALHQWARDLFRDLPQNVKLIELTNNMAENVHLVNDAVVNDPVYQAIPEEQRVGVWERKECPEEPLEVKAHCAAHWFVRSVDLDLDVDQLKAAVDQGMAFVNLYGVKRKPALPGAPPQASKARQEETWRKRFLQ